VLEDRPTLPDGSVTIPTVFHMVSDRANTPAEKARFEQMIAAQMEVLNDSYSGATASDAADTPSVSGWSARRGPPTPRGTRPYPAAAPSAT
jgi:hypothetical protein